MAATLPADGLRQIRCVASDNASLKHYYALTRILPNLQNLQCLCLDPIHLCIVYETLVDQRFLALETTHSYLLSVCYRPCLRYATWRKKTAGAILLRKIMRKFKQVGPFLMDAAFGAMCHGHESRDLTLRETRAQDLIESGNMTLTRAKKVVDEMNPTALLRCRLELLAALARLRPEDMCRRVTGANQRVSHVAWCACASGRVEWLFNKLRWRHSVRPGLRQSKKQTNPLCPRTHMLYMRAKDAEAQVTHYFYLLEPAAMKRCMLKLRLGSPRPNKSTSPPSN